MPFQPGNKLAVGNRKQYFSAAIRKHMAQNPEAAAKVVKTLFAAAEAGDVSAARELADRIDGKAVARTELAGANGSALFPVTAINVVGVEPAAIVAGELERIADAEPAAD